MSGYLINGKDIPILRSIIGDYKRRRRNNPQNTRKRWNGNGGGGSKIVRAIMLSIDCGMVGDAQVLSRPCGVRKVPGEDDDGVIKVHDRTGEFILDATIVGKQIYATYLKSYYLGTGTTHEDTENIEQPCQWEIFKVCTPGESTACEPPDVWPSAFTLTPVSTGASFCVSDQTLNYVSDDGCTATYYAIEEFDYGGGNIGIRKATMTYGCVNGDYTAQLLIEREHPFDEYGWRYSYWNSVSIDESTDPIGLFPGVEVDCTATGSIQAAKVT